MRRVLLASSALALVSLAASCAAPPPPVAPPVASLSALTPAAPEAPAPRDDGRLPALATPTHYAVTLEIDPAQPRFRGHVDISVDVAGQTRFLVLHGRDVNVGSVSAKLDSGAVVAGSAVLRVPHAGLAPEELVLTFETPLPPGRAVVSLGYDAPFAAGLGGLYRVKEGDRWYAFTQFESTSARRAFPCFDEPAFKATFDLSITTPKGSIAVANAPEKARADQPAGTRFDFVTTLPLSTYLVAFAVGDFDVREGGSDPVPIRLVSVKGKAALGGEALVTAAALARKLGDYFALPYPFPKLDLVAVPNFGAGAMENPGLITFREELLLQDPKHPSARAHRAQASVIAHELAHIWFGDLVTMQWWNDVWLNEGFATFMATKVVDQYRPESGALLESIANTQKAMDVDALANARAVRQPVASSSEIAEAFDSISYMKGAAVLRMIEHWVGPDAFQAGLREYVRAHSFKNATSADLLAALDHASGRPVSAMAATYIDRPGVPTVSVRSTCAPGTRSLDLAQSAWRPLGVVAKPTDGVPWVIPFCVREASGKKDECTDLAGVHGQLVSTAPQCSTWPYPNAGEAGYYRYSVGDADLRAIAAHEGSLGVPSRVGLLSNLWAQVRAGALEPAALLEVLPSFDRETDRHVIEELISVLYDVDHALVDDASRPAFRAYVAARMAGHARALGWFAGRGEDDDRRILRGEVLTALGGLARDPATLREAGALARGWLKDPSSLDPDVAPTALRLSTLQAPPARLGELRAAAKSAKTPIDRITALGAMGAFDDEAALRQTFDLFLTDEVKMQDLIYVFGRGQAASVLERRESARVFFDWLHDHWEVARAKLPGGLAGRLLGVIRGACDPAERDRELAFLAPKAGTLEGAQRPFAEDVEKATSCSELHAHGAASLAKFFGAPGPGAGGAKAAP